ncbi:TetR family transcriptional regulator [Nocardia sp. NPDC023852]|uniref:TetR family transcriptional regulator n=1 Tax=Nocardia sp. NPDC023852 TaxID=3154697 RepID=UPI0034003907
MSTRGEVVAEAGLRPTICAAVDEAAATLDHTGVRALRVLLHSGISAYWPLITAAPTKHLRAYEATVQTLCTRWGVRTSCAADPVASAAYQEMDTEVAAFLELCAERSGTQWLEPVGAIAAYVVSLVRGAVLRWLADGNDETILVVLDDLVSVLTTKAIEI